MQPIKKEDLLSYRFLSGVTASPDGNKAVFTVAVQDVRQNGYKKNLYLVDLATEKVEKLTSHGKAGAFLFEDSGTLLCRSRGRSRGRPHSSGSRWRRRRRSRPFPSGIRCWASGSWGPDCI